MAERILVTGSGGLIGSETVRFYCSKGAEVLGIDNDMRSTFFGPEASTRWNIERLTAEYKNYEHHNLDIRDIQGVGSLFDQPFDLIVHTAAQPSHDLAKDMIPLDFAVNAVGTVNLLEVTKQKSPDSVFIFTSTNKVYGDTPNVLPLIEQPARYEIDEDHPYFDGIDETMSVDQTKHSFFGASKLAADVMVQECGRYLGMRTGIFRGGCLTGPAHSSAQLHGFLAYLVKTIVADKEYTINGYKGKQVRDNIHAKDVVAAFDAFYQNPRQGEVYNIGGCRFSNTSIIEAVETIESITGKKARIKYQDEPRTGDHIWYISSMEKFKKHYPNWQHTYDGEKILEELCREALKHDG